MLFDTHAHMDDRAFDADRETLLSALPEQGIGLLMNPGCSLASSSCGEIILRFDTKSEYGSAQTIPRQWSGESTGS